MQIKYFTHLLIYYIVGFFLSIFILTQLADEMLKIG